MVLFLISYFYQIARRQVRLCCLLHSFPVSIQLKLDQGWSMLSISRPQATHVQARAFYFIKTWRTFFQFNSSSLNLFGIQTNHLFPICWVYMGWFLILISTCLLFTFPKKPVIVRGTKDYCPVLCTMCTASLWEENQD